MKAKRENGFCDELPGEGLLQAVGLSGRGAYRACHDVLERLWLEEEGPGRDFYKGLLQLAVACHHVERGNLRGGVKLVASGLELLAPFLPACRGIDTRCVTRDFTEFGQEVAMAIEGPRVLVPPRRFALAGSDSGT